MNNKRVEKIISMSGDIDEYEEHTVRLHHVQWRVLESMAEFEKIPLSHILMRIVGEKMDEMIEEGQLDLQMVPLQ